MVFFFQHHRTQGLVHHRIALDPKMSDHGSNTEHIRKHLSMAIEAFDKCLEPTGRPHLSVCELGVARSLNMAAKLLYEADDASDESIRISFERDAKIAYTNLLNNWAQVNGNGTLYYITLLIHLLRGFTLNITTRTRILNSNTNARTQVQKCSSRCEHGDSHTHYVVWIDT